jgi:predicted RNA binding protein YcfA (HicA-like mRNA interferase family)
VLSGRWRRPLSYREIVAILKKLGFQQRAQGATSHEQWVKTEPRFYKVTVDPPKQPFGPTLVSIMAKQAGVSVRQFYEILDDS